MTGSINRYLLYVLFHSADDVRFSYVENLGSDSKLEPSMYLKLLGCKTAKPKPNKVMQLSDLQQPRVLCSVASASLQRRLQHVHMVRRCERLV